MVRADFRIVLVVAAALCGCGRAQPRLQITSADEVGSEIERVADEIGPPASFEFRTAAQGLVAHNAAKVKFEAVDQAAIDTLHGKTSRAIIAEWNALTADERAASLKIVEGATKPEPQSTTSESDRRLIKATTKLAVSSRGQDQQVGIAMVNARRVQQERSLPDTWLAEQFEKGADHMIKEFGANSPNAEK